MSLFSPSKPHHLVTVLALAAAAILLGAWELTITRLASVLYFFDLTYLALAVCLFGLGAGALWTKQDSGGRESQHRDEVMGRAELLFPLESYPQRRMH